MGRMGKSMNKLHPNYDQNVPATDSLYLGKLKGKFASVEKCSTALKLGSNLSKRIEEVAEDKNMSAMMINGKIVSTSTEPCQHHQRNVCIDGVAREYTKYM